MLDSAGAGAGATVTESGEECDGDADVVVDDVVAAAGFAVPGVDVLHPVIMAKGMTARKATSEVRRVAFIFLASTNKDVPAGRTFQGSPG